MFLGAYHFDGDPAALVPAYERLMASFPIESIDLHVCVIRDAGITVYDACPSPAVFRSFSHGAEFTTVVAAAGLPVPRVEPLGAVHRAHLREPVPT